MLENDRVKTDRPLEAAKDDAMTYLRTRGCFASAEEVGAVLAAGGWRYKEPEWSPDPNSLDEIADREYFGPRGSMESEANTVLCCLEKEGRVRFLPDFGRENCYAAVDRTEP
jgi:hypothetical protein